MLSLSNKDLISKSYDHKYYKHMVTALLVLFAVLVVPLAIVFAFLGKPGGGIAFAIIMLLFFAPFAGNYIVKLYSYERIQTVISYLTQLSQKYILLLREKCISRFRSKMAMEPVLQLTPGEFLRQV